MKKDTLGIPVLVVDDQHVDVICVVCLAESGMLFTNRRGYRIDCPACRCRHYYNGDRSMRLARAWQRVLRDSVVREQLVERVAAEIEH